VAIFVLTSPVFALLYASMRVTAFSIASGEGCTYLWESVTVLWPISFIIVKASAPVSPSRVPYVAAR